jgi:hypothetical protein
MSKGLVQQIKLLQAEINREERKAKAVHVDPRDQHDAKESAERAQRRLTVAVRGLEENDAVIESLRDALTNLDGSEHKSRSRSLAFTHIEDAILRLQHDNNHE